MIEQQRKIQQLEQDLRRQRPEIPQRAALFAVRYSTNNAQTFTTGAVTVVDYDDASYDAGGRVTTGAAWQYLCDSPGVYAVSAAALLANTTNWALGEAGTLLLYKNGAAASVLCRNDWMNSAVTGQFKHLAGTDHILLATGDLLDIRLRQDSGANLALHTDANFNYVAIAKIA